MDNIDSISDFSKYRDEAHLKYEIIRPVLLSHITIISRAKELQLSERILTKYLERFRKDGYAGLLDQRHGPLKRAGELNQIQKAHLIILHLAYAGFS